MTTNNEAINYGKMVSSTQSAISRRAWAITKEEAFKNLYKAHGRHKEMRVSRQVLKELHKEQAIAKRVLAVLHTLGNSERKEPQWNTGFDIFLGEGF